MLKVMTFNIRYGTAEDGESHWERRKSLVIDRIKTFDPDLLGQVPHQDVDDVGAQRPLSLTASR